MVCGGLEYCTSLYAIDRATFPFYAIEYVARGKGQLLLNGHHYELHRGRVFSYGPRIPHHISGSITDPLVKYFVDFTGGGSLELLQSCGLSPGRVIQVFPPHILEAIYEEIIESGSRSTQRNAALCARLTECLALKIAASRAPLEGAQSLAFVTYQQSRHHIARNYVRLRTLLEISRECHVSSAHLCRLFKKYDHESPYQLLLRLKMNAAAERLGHSGVLVKQVAEEMGFADQFHFSRVFKATLGISPAAFRRLR